MGCRHCTVCTHAVGGEGVSRECGHVVVTAPVARRRAASGGSQATERKTEELKDGLGRQVNGEGARRPGRERTARSSAQTERARAQHST